MIQVSVKCDLSNEYRALHYLTSLTCNDEMVKIMSNEITTYTQFEKKIM